MKIFAAAMTLAVVTTPAFAGSKAHHHNHARHHHARMVVMDAQPFAAAPWVGPQQGPMFERPMTRRERRALAAQQAQGFGAPFGAQPTIAAQPVAAQPFDAIPPRRVAIARGRDAAPGQGAYAEMVQRHAAANGVPASLVHRVIMRESRYNPRAVSKGNYGMMQIRLGTARAMGYTGGAAGLLDPEVNMTYAVKYLAGAYKVAGGSESAAVGHYARGYYYAAKRRGVSPYEAPGTAAFAQASAPRVGVAAGRAGGGSETIARLTMDRHAAF